MSLLTAIVTASSLLAVNTNTIVQAATATTQTLPALPPTGTVCSVKNQGAGVLTVLAGTAIIFAASPVASLTLGGIGVASTLTFDGTYWNVS